MDPTQSENQPIDPQPPSAEAVSPESAAALPSGDSSAKPAAELVALPLETVSSWFERWLVANLAPLGVLVLSLSLTIGLGPFIDTKATPKADLAAAAATASAALPELEKPLRLNGVNLGVLCLIGMIAVYFSNPGARKWSKQFTPRPLPALRIMDLLALLMVSRAVATVLVLVAQRTHLTVLVRASGKPAMLATEMILGDLIFLAAVVVAIGLARFRARGVHGSMGVWPFWKLIQGRRSVFRDMALGAACYPVFFLLGNMFFVPLGHELAEYCGVQPKPHPLLLVLKEPLKTWELIVFALSATAGAAFFEELLFRGVLYNGLRRYFGAWFGAAAATLVFAVLHPVGDWFGIFFLGMMLTWLYDKTGRLVSSMTLHFINNSMAVIATLSYEYLQRHLK